MKAAQEEGNGIMSAAWRGDLIRGGAHEVELTMRFPRHARSHEVHSATDGDRVCVHILGFLLELAQPACLRGTSRSIRISSALS